LPGSRFSGELWWQGGKRKESLRPRLWNLNICIEKLDAKCSLAKMTLVMTSLPLVTGGNLTAQLTGSHRGIADGIQILETVASSPSFSHPTARVPWRACSQA